MGLGGGEREGSYVAIGVGGGGRERGLCKMTLQRENPRTKGLA